MDRVEAERLADLAEVARVLAVIVEAVDRGELHSPRWLRDRIKAAGVTASATQEMIARGASL